MDIDFETIGRIAPILAIPGAILGSYIGNKIHFAEFKTTVLLKLSGIADWQEKQDEIERRQDDKIDENGREIGYLKGKLNGHNKP